jgi:muconolactone D-isomerase
MNRIQAILTIDTDNLPDNFQEIVKHEQEVIAKWKEEGILDHFFLRQTRNGAVLIFKGVDEEKVKELMATLPLYKLKKSVEYLNLINQF